MFVLMFAAPAWAQELVVNKEDNPDPVEVGDLLLYTIVVENAGNETATDVVLGDALPVNTTFVSATPSAGIVCIVPSPGTRGGIVTCNLGNLEPDEVGTVEILVRPTAEAGEVGFVTNTVTIAGTNTTPAVATELTQVIPNDEEN